MIAISDDMVPDPHYQPRVGDRAVLFAFKNGAPLDRLPLLKDVTAYDVYVRGSQTGDAERLSDLEQQGWLRWVAPGTRVNILGTQDRNHTGAHTASEVRVLDDQFKDQTFWTPSDYVTRLVHKDPN
jgi:hypothetical protein